MTDGVTTEYTPTTGEVKEVYAQGLTRRWGMFDRWLAAHDAVKDQQITEQAIKCNNDRFDLLRRAEVAEAKIAAVAELADAITRDSHCSHLGRDIRTLLTTTGQEQRND
ncbi:hypothetical protein GCM10022239_03580 [Leifsonia bigeumensis]|uniref:Uncharacterized protein n=1 Tax=Leifsonella bigeumensis TaxID=433643 RepID=A0ABP7F4L2_9MICO